MRPMDLTLGMLGECNSSGSLAIAFTFSLYLAVNKVAVACPPLVHMDS